jgi:trigger factor
LKEHFILERIAEDEKIEAETEDYEQEVSMIAAQSGESARRVRARLEKGGLMDALRNQIIERKVIELVQSKARFKDVPFKPEAAETEALDQAAGGGEDPEIPEAKNPGEAEPLRTTKERE